MPRSIEQFLKDRNLYRDVMRKGHLQLSRAEIDEMIVACQFELLGQYQREYIIYIIHENGGEFTVSIVNDVVIKCRGIDVIDLRHLKCRVKVGNLTLQTDSKIISKKITLIGDVEISNLHLFNIDLIGEGKICISESVFYRNHCTVSGVEMSGTTAKGNVSIDKEIITYDGCEFPNGYKSLSNYDGEAIIKYRRSRFAILHLQSDERETKNAKLCDERSSFYDCELIFLKSCTNTYRLFQTRLHNCKMIAKGGESQVSISGSPLIDGCEIEGFAGVHGFGSNAMVIGNTRFRKINSIYSGSQGTVLAECVFHDVIGVTGCRFVGTQIIHRPFKTFVGNVLCRNTEDNSIEDIMELDSNRTYILRDVSVALGFYDLLRLILPVDYRGAVMNDNSHDLVHPRFYKEMCDS